MGEGIPQTPLTSMVCAMMEKKTPLITLSNCVNQTELLNYMPSPLKFNKLPCDVLNIG